jgi:N-acetylneuraminic acid mutarotase
MQNTIPQSDRHTRWLAVLLLLIVFAYPLKSLPGADAAQVTYWSQVGSPATGRYLHTATLLQNGKVLIAGGLGARAMGATPLKSAELYDPTTGTWSPTGMLGTARFYHTAVLLTNGKVLVAGGVSQLVADGGFASPLDSAEIYDPASGVWNPAGNFSTARGAHTATLLQDGRVLIAGGALVNVDSTASVQLYNPATGAWSAAANLNTARSAHTATRLADGRVLVAGGLGNNQILASAEIYDPVANSWTATGALNTARFHFTSTALPNGQVLAVGGGADLAFDSFTGNALSSAELYNPATGSWATDYPLNTPRGLHTATLLPNGQVLVSGGLTGKRNATAAAELRDPTFGRWSNAPQFDEPRFLHTVTLLPSGQALAVGSVDLNPNKRAITFIGSTQVFDPLTASGEWFVTDSLRTPRSAPPSALSPDHSATLLPFGAGSSGALFGTVLVAGGSSLPTVHDAVELYNPGSKTWSLSPFRLTRPRRQHTATLLANGKVLLAGGSDSSGQATNTAEVFDLNTGALRTANNLSAASRGHTATLLADGRVLIAGGENESSLARASGANVAARSVPTALVLGRAELYNPATNSFSATGSLAQARSGHTAVLLPNGKILVAGGTDLNNAALASVELYDPLTGAWSTTSKLNTARRLHTATLLPSGKVLVAGGETGNAATETAELYDPATGAWTARTRLRSPRYSHTATLLSTGQVLVAGGHNGSVAIREVEVYDPATNSWTITGAMDAPRSLHTATLLLDGQTLVVGGAGVSIPNPKLSHNTPSSRRVVGGAGVSSTPNTSELFDPAPAITRNPALAAVPASLTLGSKLTITGSGFAGGLEGSSGNAQSSAANYPLLQLRSLSNEQTRFLQADPASVWSGTSFTSQAVGAFPRGYALVSVVSNGATSNARSLVIGCSAITVSPLSLPAATACAFYTQTFAAAGGAAPYTFNAPVNRLPPGLQLMRDMLLGTPTQAGSFIVPITVTDANGCSSQIDLPLTINLPTLTIRATPAATSFAQSDPQRRPNPTPLAQCITLENSGCSRLAFRLDSIVRVGGERITEPNDWRSLSDPNDRRPYSVVQLTGNALLQLTPNTPINVGAGGTARLCVVFDPLVPRRASSTNNLAAQQVMPEQFTSQLRFVESQTQSQLNVAVEARLNPLVKLIHPSDVSLPPVVTLARAGDQFTVSLAVYDPNMDLYLIRYQFLDGGGKQVEPDIDVDMADFIARAGLVRGQSFGVTQRFSGASNRSEVAGVRVIVYDRTGDESAVSVPGSLAANARRARQPSSGFTLELPMRALTAIARKPQPTTRGREK